MIGPRVGLRVGGRQGPAVGVGADPLGKQGLVGVAQDATALKYVPASSAQWATVMTAAGIATGPSHLWLLQDAAGPLADSIGSATLVAYNTLALQQAAAGWTRLGIKPIAGIDCAYGDVGGNFSTASGLLLQYITVGNNAADAKILSVIGATERESAALYLGPKLLAFSGADSQLGAVDYSGIAPIVTKYDVTADAVTVYSHMEKISPATFTVQNPTNEDLVLIGGDSAGNASNSVTVMAALWKGAPAEMTDANVRSLLQTLGWTVAW